MSLAFPVKNTAKTITYKTLATESVTHDRLKNALGDDNDSWSFFSALLKKATITNDDEHGRASIAPQRVAKRLMMDASKWTTLPVLLVEVVLLKEGISKSSPHGLREIGELVADA